MSEVEDKRYRVAVLLHRVDRPMFWDFHCPYCKAKVVEIAGERLVALDDSVDSGRPGMKGYLCPGWHSVKCDTWFYFEGSK